MKLGGKAIFFSHGGEYEYLAKNLGCEIIQVEPIYTDKYIDFLWQSSRLETIYNPFRDRLLKKHVEAEIEAFKNSDVELIITTNNLPCAISVRAANLPLVCITPKVSSSYTTYPDDAEFLITRYIPNSLKVEFLNWYAPLSKIYVKPFAKLAKHHDVKTPKLLSDIFLGDYTMYTDFIELLDINKEHIPSNEFYIGPIFFDELFSTMYTTHDGPSEQKLINHISKGKKSILVSLGSSGTKKLFLDILQALNKTEFQVIAVCTSILDDDKLPKLNNNILLTKFVPSMKNLNSLVDLAIIHGGQGTVYTAAYAGKPIIGFPMQFEQHLNLEMLVKKGMAKILSRKYFKEENLLSSIQEIFDHYNTFYENAQNLARKLSTPQGEKNAVDILNEHILHQIP